MTSSESSLMSIRSSKASTSMTSALPSPPRWKTRRAAASCFACTSRPRSVLLQDEDLVGLACGGLCHTLEAAQVANTHLTQPSLEEAEKGAIATILVARHVLEEDVNTQPNFRIELNLPSFVTPV